MIVCPILISGAQGSGKTTLAHELIKYFNDQEKKYAKGFIFADVIYQIHDFTRGLLRSLEIERPDKDGKLLQLLGTEYGRETIDQNIWVNTCKAQIQQWVKRSGTMGMVMVPVISDCRFRNEFDAFPNALRVRLECPEQIRKSRCPSWRDTTNHPSETDLNEYAKMDKFTIKIPTNDIDIQTSIHLVTTAFEEHIDIGVGVL